MRIPLSAPDITDQEISAVTEVLRSSRLSLGPKTTEFERGIAQYVGATHAVAVTSGTAALHLCIRAIGIGEGDEVIVPSFAFIAVANAIRYERGTPVFVDIDPETFNLDPSQVEAAITSRTKAIIVVHTFGCPADLAAILEIAKRNSLFLIEDSCEAVGAEYDGRRVGVLGDLGVFAFYPNKQMTTGEGGVVVTQNAKLAALIKSLRNHGRNDSDDCFEHVELGYNYRISEINCALGCEQMRRLDAILARREEIAEEYSRRLRGVPALKLPSLTMPRRKISWFVYVVTLSSEFSKADRNWIVEEMKNRGIDVGRYFAPIHLQPAYRTIPHRALSLTVTERVSARVIALPFFNLIQGHQIDEVCRLLVHLIEEVRNRAHKHVIDRVATPRRPSASQGG
jgi:perosamine synthetase